MTDKVHPTQGEASSQLTSGAIKWAAQTDWIVPSGEDYLAAFAGLSGTPLNGFQESHSASSYDVTIDTGEGFVGGRWCGRDVTTTVTLASSTNNQTVYAGWESSTANSVVIGLDSAFSSSDDGRQTEIWEFDTDGSGVTSSTKLHDNEPIHPHAANADQLDGVSPDSYAQVNQAETISKSWAHDTKTTFRAENNDVMLWEDGSGGSVSEALTVVYGSRGTRFYSGRDGLPTIEFFPDATVRIYNNSLNMSGNQIQYFRVHNRSSRPSGTATGRMIYRTDKE